MSYTQKQIECMAKRSAIRRRLRNGSRDINVPLKMILQKSYIKPGIEVLDFGAGFGTEVEYLRLLGCKADGYDPNFEMFKEEPTRKYDIVLCSYVLNTVTIASREQIVQKLKKHASGLVFIAVRSTRERVEGERFEDGVVTSIKTFQKLFTPDELRDFLSRFFEVVDIISTNPIIARCREGVPNGRTGIHEGDRQTDSA